MLSELQSNFSYKRPPKISSLSGIFTVFIELRSRKTVRFSEQIMSADKYPCIFSRQMETIVYIVPVRGKYLSLRSRRIKGRGWGRRKRIRGKNGGVEGGGREKMIAFPFPELSFSSTTPSRLYAFYAG